MRALCRGQRRFRRCQQRQVRRRRRSDSRTKALIFRVFQALLPLRHALLPLPLMISTRNF